MIFTTLEEENSLASGPDISPDITSPSYEIMAHASPDITPRASPDITPPSSDVTPRASPDITARASLDIMPPSPNVTPQASPDIAAHASPDVKRPFPHITALASPDMQPPSPDLTARSSPFSCAVSCSKQSPHSPITEEDETEDEFVQLKHHQFGQFNHLTTTPSLPSLTPEPGQSAGGNLSAAFTLFYQRVCPSLRRFVYLSLRPSEFPRNGIF